MRYWLTICLIIAGACCHAQQDTIHVYFDAKSAELNSAAFQTIDSNLYYDILVKGTPAGIIGYADYPGNSKANIELAQARAQTVVAYLLSMGMNETDIQAVDGVLSGDKKSKISIPENRRVDIIVGGFKIPFDNTLPVKQAPNPSSTAISDKAEIIRLEKLEFEPGTTNIKGDTDPALEQLLQRMKENEQITIQVEGHVCCINLYTLPAKPGKRDLAFQQVVEEEAMLLSLKRAQKVREYLAKNGISKNRMKVKGFGFSVPVYEADGKTIIQRRNRRVEIRILEK